MRTSRSAMQGRRQISPRVLKGRRIWRDTRTRLILRFPGRLGRTKWVAFLMAGAIWGQAGSNGCLGRHFPLSRNRDSLEGN